MAADPVSDALAQLGHRAEGDPLRAVDAYLRSGGSAGKLIDRLLPVVAGAASGAAAARAEIATGAAFLARGENARARELLQEGLSHLGASDADAFARASLKLARALVALDDARAARAGVSRALGGILALQDDGALGELATVLRAVDQAVAADLVEELRRERKRAPERGEARITIVAQLLRVLTSSLAGTSEPLNAILRVVLDETGGQRGFIMLYDHDVLRFELGMSRDGRVLGQDEFRYSTSVVASALGEGRCVLIPDLWASSLPIAAATSAQELGIRSAMCAPLRTGRKRQGAPELVEVPSVQGIAGVLCVDSPMAASFGERDVAFYEILADCASVSVRAARTAEALRAQRAADAEEKELDAKGRRLARRPAIAETATLDHSYDELVGRDPALRAMLKLLDRVIPSDANVIVRGESGTGKELVARAIHRLGRRARGPFVAIDCGAIPEELIQAELFGHEAGAFTGANDARAGLLERAEGGILFLDEVGEMPPSMQAALLRVLQEGEVRRLGGASARPFDARVVAATHRDLRSMVERGEFRHDLFFRLAVVEVRVPPLRERRSDIPLLVDHLLNKIAAASKVKPPALAPAALARLEEHGWPGNIRELENVLQGLVLTGRETIELEQVDDALEASPAKPPEPERAAPARGGAPLEGTLEELERRAIAERLERFRWNQVQAAESLGIDRRTLYRKIRRFGLKRGGG